jgi:transposase
MGYRSEEFRKSAVQKLHSRGSRRVEDIARELGVSTYSLYHWAKAYATSPGMKMKKSERRPQDWSAAEKLEAVIEFEKLAPEKQGEYLRREGLHSDHIAAWKKSMQAALESASKPSAQERAERAEDRRKIKELERELNRKDKALAETTALLVLKKKADLIWGTGNGENE